MPPPSTACLDNDAALTSTVLPGEAPGLAYLTFPALRGILLQPTPQTLTAVLRLDGQPAGLALGRLDGDGGALLESICVAPPHRRRGLGRTLLAAWEQAAIERGVNLAWARYSDSLPRRQSLDALLDAGGWLPPEPIFYRVTGLAGKMVREGAAWAGVEGRVLRNARFLCGPPQLSPADDAAIDRLLAQPEARAARDPRAFAGNMLEDFSTAVRLPSGELCGWIVATPGDAAAAGALRIPPHKLVQYEECYLDSGLWNTCATLAAIVRCFTRQAGMLGEDSVFTYRTHPGMARMVAFTRRRFAPMALSFATVLRRMKRFDAAHGRADEA